MTLAKKQSYDTNKVLLRVLERAAASFDRDEMPRPDQGETQVS